MNMKRIVLHVLFGGLSAFVYIKTYLALYTPPYQEIPVACDGMTIDGNIVSCWWGDLKQTSYECPEGIEQWEIPSCEFILCKKESNIAVLLRNQLP